ncbi:hypothetical protein [Pseudovibrio ascidiaceicola]|uniref:hypothetical protein n=1 Tax=Pseudovibrio ascidiaceicola TaxID=285279 RepID=UPI000D6A03D1|nr:hypothetical protein [Pseudovibrio ascidiaceicola]
MLSFTSARYRVLVALIGIVLLGSFGGFVLAVIYDLNLSQGRLCDGFATETPWACSRAWISALSGWAAAIGAILAALYAGSLVKVQIDKTVEANSIARFSFASEALNFIANDLIKISTLRRHENTARSFRRSMDQKEIVTRQDNLRDLIESVDKTRAYLFENKGLSIKFLPPSCFELRERLLIEVSCFAYNSAETDKHVNLINDVLRSCIKSGEVPFDEKQIHRTLNALEDYFEAVESWKEKLQDMQAIAFGHN